MNFSRLSPLFQTLGVLRTCNRKSHRHSKASQASSYNSQANNRQCTFPRCILGMQLHVVATNSLVRGVDPARLQAYPQANRVDHCVEGLVQVFRYLIVAQQHITHSLAAGLNNASGKGNTVSTWVAEDLRRSAQVRQGQGQYSECQAKVHHSKHR